MITNRTGKNIWDVDSHFSSSKPTILLNSHHDTVKPHSGYTRDPFEPAIEEGKLYGLGSNDAGGALVCLMALFVHFYEKEDLNYNLVIAATAEEESSGDNGILAVLPLLPEIDFAVVGEPTKMQMAVAEKGLLVIDGYAPGIGGHAAHENTENAIYNALQDINWIRSYAFPEVSPVLGKVKMSVTQIEAGTQHNVVPASCHFVVDVRVNECYSNEEVFDVIDIHTRSKMVSRSFKLNSSSIPLDHPIVKAGEQLRLEKYGSPTLSDQANLTCPSLKMGPGDSLRSHSADEFIMLEELERGIDIYIAVFEKLLG